MIDLFYLAANIQKLFIKNHWKFCFIGGIALQRWGEPRLTKDIDISLLTGFGKEIKFIDLLLEHYQGRITDAKTFAIKNRVLLLQSNDGIGIDISLSGLPFEKAVIKRATKFQYLPKINLLTCSAEDLIVLKSFADRTRDWLDVETTIIRQQNKLDWNYIFKKLRPLCEIKESPDIILRLENLRKNNS